MNPTSRQARTDASRFEDNRLLTVAELCELVPNTNPPYWAELRYRGTGPEYVKLTAKRLLYPERQFREWLASKARTSTRDGAA